jgi:cytochrome c oxidase assembly protein subunit 17
MEAKSQTNNPVSEVKTDGEEKKLKPCCACPATKKLRDQCIFNNGVEKCEDFINAHKECLRSKGFKVD